GNPGRRTSCFVSPCLSAKPLLELGFLAVSDLSIGKTTLFHGQAWTRGVGSWTWPTPSWLHTGWTQRFGHANRTPHRRSRPPPQSAAPSHQDHLYPPREGLPPSRHRR